MLGYQVAVAVDGLDGVDKATELLPDITLMDIQMPGINGFEAMRRLRANERTKGLQIIATTAMAMERDRQQCFDAGADSYSGSSADGDVHCRKAGGQRWV